MTNYLTTVRGTIAQATLKEIFVFTIAGVATSDANTVATAVKNAFGTAWAASPTIANQTSSQVVYTEVTAAEILNMSTGALKAASHVPFAPTLTGSGTSLLPSQCSIAISTAGGAKPNGTPYRGRFYIPGPQQSVLTSTTGLMANPTTYLTWAKNFLVACIANSFVPAVWSRKDGNMNIITAIRVGDRVDTIRSRRNELPETYVTATIP
jgi:hypothetical protein